MTVELVHGAECECQRCTGFAPGNLAAVTHGCWSPLTLAPRAREIREEAAGLVPLSAASDEPLLDLLAFTLAQVERAGLVLGIEQASATSAIKEGKEPPPRLDRLANDARAWVRTAAKLLDQLGMSPTSRARLGLDVALAHRAADAALDRLAAEGGAIRERREAG